jgi:hypothetical protein
MTPSEFGKIYFPCGWDLSMIMMTKIMAPLRNFESENQKTPKVGRSADRTITVDLSFVYTLTLKARYPQAIPPCGFS